MLANGPYPEVLKQRVGGSHGHLSNQQSLDLLRQIDTAGLKCLIAAHISEKNNKPSIVGQALDNLEQLPTPVLADQDLGFDWITI